LMHEVVGSQWFRPETGLQVPQTGLVGLEVTRVTAEVRKRATVMKLFHILVRSLCA
jgi:hypothetical protein